MAEFVYTVDRVVSTIGGTDEKPKRLTVTSWNRREPTLDLRAWIIDGNTTRPGKGMTLSRDEAENLVEALQDYLGES